MYDKYNVKYRSTQDTVIRSNRTTQAIAMVTYSQKRRLKLLGALADQSLMVLTVLLP